MPTAQGEVRTDRASRYLIQLCQHTSHMGSGLMHRMRGHGGGKAGPQVRDVHWSDTEGVIDFGSGRCTLHATETALLLSAEADDEEHLEQIKAGIAARVNRIGRRDQLTVTWS